MKMMNPSRTETTSLTSRPFSGDADLRSLLDLLMISRRSTNDWHYPHIGEFLWNYFMVLIHLDPCQHIRLWHSSDGQLVAFASLAEDPLFDCQVLPEFEWTGIEEDAFRWAESLLETLRRDDPKTWGGELASTARQDDLRRIQFLEQHGFAYRGRFAEVNMLLSLDQPIPALPVPVGCQVRALLPGEIAERAALEREVWQPWTVGNVSDDDYLQLIRLPGYLPELEIVTVAHGGRIAAQVNGWLDPLNRIGDLGPVGARQEYRRLGLTRLALLECLRRMQAFGMDRACISTGITNTPALNLYASIGFTVENRTLDFTKSA